MSERLWEGRVCLDGCESESGTETEKMTGYVRKENYTSEQVSQGVFATTPPTQLPGQFVRLHSHKPLVVIHHHGA